MKMNLRPQASAFCKNRCAIIATLVGLSIFASHQVWSAPSFTITPSAVSNGYTGFIRLQISGLTNGEAVKIGKYLDANTNNVIDAGDMLIQAFSLKDGQASLIGGATNINVPGDASAADGTITARLSFVAGGFDQQLVGTYAYKLSSPVGNFAPITNWFQVTNAGLAQSITGSVRCSGTNVPNAVAMLFTPPTGNGGMNPVGGAVANSSGNYRLEAAPGTYLVWAFKSNFVADMMTSPIVTLGSGATINTNLVLAPATQTISGQVVDAANGNLPLRGISVFWMSANNQISSGFTDTNGIFTVGVTPGQWQFGGDEQVFSFLGYLGSKDSLAVDTTTGSVAGVTIAVPKATALFYGSIKDGQGRAMVNVRVSADPNNGGGSFEGGGVSDAEGNYAIGVTAGTWSVQVKSDDPAFANYIFSKPFDSTNVNNGQAIQANVTAIPAAYHLTGYVRNNNNQPVGNVGVYAWALINGATYNQYTDTDASGFYSMAVANGSWDVGLNCGGGNDSVEAQGYLCPNHQTANIQNGDSILNFTVSGATSQISGFVKDTLGNPIPNVGVSAWESTSGYNMYQQTDPSGYFSLRVPNGTYNVNVSCGGSPDSLDQLGYFCVDQQTVTVNNSTGIVNFSALAAPYQISGHVLTGTGAPVANLGVSANATLNGTQYNQYAHTDANGYYAFRAASATWSVGLNCNYGPDSLNALGYLCVDNQSVTVGNANVVENFTVSTAPSQISGYVRDNLGNPIANVGVGGWAIFNGTNLNVGSSTDSTGHYVLLVPNGSWNINVACGGWPGALDNLGYLCVGSQIVNVTNTTAVANFTTMPAAYQVSGHVLDSTNRPIANIGVYASATINSLQFSAYVMTDGTGYYQFPAANGTWTIGLECNALRGQGYLCPGQKTNTVAGGNLSVNFTVQPLLPLSITTTSLPNATVGVFYSQVLQASGGQPPYFWDFSSGSGPLPPGLTLWQDGTISGMPGTTGTYNFSVHAYDNGSAADNANQPLSITVNAAGPSVRLTGTTLLPNGQIQFSFNTVSGRSYTVQYSSNLSNWFDLVTFSGTGSMITNSYPATSGGTQRFYRVQF